MAWRSTSADIGSYKERQRPVLTWQWHNPHKSQESWLNLIQCFKRNLTLSLVDNNFVILHGDCNKSHYDSSRRLQQEPLWLFTAIATRAIMTPRRLQQEPLWLFTAIATRAIMTLHGACNKSHYDSSRRLQQEPLWLHGACNKSHYDSSRRLQQEPLCHGACNKSHYDSSWRLQQEPLKRTLVVPVHKEEPGATIGGKCFCTSARSFRFNRQATGSCPIYAPCMPIVLQLACLHGNSDISTPANVNGVVLLQGVGSVLRNPHCCFVSPWLRTCGLCWRGSLHGTSGPFLTQTFYVL
jgi:hypothetical protein